METRSIDRLTSLSAWLPRQLLHPLCASKPESYMEVEVAPCAWYLIVSLEFEGSDTQIGAVNA